MSDMSECTVLVVDDTKANIDIIVDMLEDDYDIRVALDGETALEDAFEFPPDLILLDIMMPGMDGYQVCEELKNHEKTADIPVVFLTAMSETKDEERGLALGAIDFISKPFSPELVKARVHNHLKLKLANDKIKGLYDNLKESEEARHALTHMIVHDLKNPLLAIKGTVNLIEMFSSGIPENISKSYNQIRCAVTEMENLVGSILDISKLESNTMEINKVVYDASRLGDEIFEETANIYHVAGVSLFKSFDCSSSICSDVELIRRIIKNLLSNSLKFSKKGSSVDFVLVETAEGVLFRISDSGPGIPEEHREKIFNKYYQIKSKEVKKQCGVGLGLAFCKMASDEMGTAIWVEERPDGKQGASFCFMIPN